MGTRWRGKGTLHVLRDIRYLRVPTAFSGLSPMSAPPCASPLSPVAPHVKPPQRFSGPRSLHALLAAPLSSSRQGCLRALPTQPARVFPVSHSHLPRLKPRALPFRVPRTRSRPEKTPAAAAAPPAPFPAPRPRCLRSPQTPGCRAAPSPPRPSMRGGRSIAAGTRGHCRARSCGRSPEGGGRRAPLPRPFCALSNLRGTTTKAIPVASRLWRGCSRTRCRWNNPPEQHGIDF